MALRYIADLLQPYTPTRQLRSSSKNLLVTQKSNFKFYGERSFQVAAPWLWNSLTDDIRSIQNLYAFKNKIKTLLFIDAFISQFSIFYPLVIVYIFSFQQLKMYNCIQFLSNFNNSNVFSFQNYDYCKAHLSSRKWRYINCCITIIIIIIIIIIITITIIYLFINLYIIYLRICTSSTGAKTIGHKSPTRFKHQPNPLVKF